MNTGMVIGDSQFVLRTWLGGWKFPRGLFVLLVLFGALGGVSAQVTLTNIQMDVLKAVQSNSATITSSPLDLGAINNVFDGQTNTLARTPNINPAFVQVAYARPRTLTRLRVYLSYGTSYDWWVEKADSQADMDSRSGSWSVVTGTNRVVSWNWGEQNVSPVTGSVFRLWVRRYGGDGYCHMNEWELYGNVDIDRLDLAPLGATLLSGESRQFTVTGYSSALDESFALGGLVQWKLNGSIGTLSPTGLFTPGNAGTGSVTASVSGALTASAQVTVGQSQPDIDVLYIERTPRLAFDPSDANYRSGLPAPGQRVTYLAHVKNWGATPVQVPYEWWFDGERTDAGEVSLAGGQELTVPFAWAWETNNHELEFRADPAGILYEATKLNNRVKIRSNALLVGLWVEESLYKYFHQGQLALNDGANSFEDWGQRMVTRWNLLFSKAIFPVAPEGFLDRVALDKVVVVPDGALPLAGGLAGNNPDSRDRTVDMEWGYSWNPANTNAGEFYGFRWNGPFFIDFGSIHEMNHARYHIDLYALDENQNANQQNVLLIDDDTGQLVAGTPKMPFIAWDVVYYNKWRDIMGAGPPVFDAYSAGAWNWKHHRRGQGNQNSPPDLGRFLNDLPLTNHVQFIDQRGVPLAGAEVSVFRSSGGFYGKVFDAAPDQVLAADTNGWIHLGRNPFGALPDFGYSSPILIFKMRYGGELYFMFQEVTDFNIQNWMAVGAQQQAKDGFYTREIDLRNSAVTVPNNQWLGNYFNGTNFDVFVTNRVEGNATGLDLQWSQAPADGVAGDNYSVYWQGGIAFTEGWKQFAFSSDGGLRMWIDGRLVFDQWTNTSPHDWKPVIYTTANAPSVNPGRTAAYGTYHRVEVRYRHSGPAGGHVGISWTDEMPPQDVPHNAWRADYYSTTDLQGYLMTREETAIDNVYGSGSPDPVVGTDNFSARWTGDFDFPGGNVTFTAVPDDGMRVYIDGVRVLDKWIAQPPTTYNVTRSLSAGTHRLQVEYFEGSVTAQAVFGWKLAPWFITAPSSQVVVEGATVELSGAASGSPAPQYQWLFNKQAIAGATTSRLVITNAQASAAGTYTLMLTNSTGTASANATLTVLPAGAVPSVSQPALLSGGAFQLLLNGAVGWNYDVQSSSNLVDWVTVGTIALTNGSAIFMDETATNSATRFYRAVIRP